MSLRINAFLLGPTGHLAKRGPCLANAFFYTGPQI